MLAVVVDATNARAKRGRCWWRKAGAPPHKILLEIARQRFNILSNMAVAIGGVRGQQLR